MILSWITVKDNEDGSTQLIDFHFHTEVARNLERLTKRKSSVNTILERIQTYNREGSNRRFQRVTSLKIHLNRYKPLGGLSYIKFLVRLRRRRQSWTSRTRMKSAFDGKFSGTSTQSSRTLRGSQAWEKRLSLIEKCHSHSNRLKIQIISFGSNEMPRERQTTAAAKRNQGGLSWLSSCSLLCLGCVELPHLMTTLFVKLSVEMFPSVVNGNSETVLKPT